MSTSTDKQDDNQLPERVWLSKNGVVFLDKPVKPKTFEFTRAVSPTIEERIRSLEKELAEAHERLAQHQQQIDHELEQRKQENAARRRFRQLKKETKSYYGDDSP